MDELQQPDPTTTPHDASRTPWQDAIRPYLWGGGQWRPAARRVAILLPLAVNIILLVILGILTQQVFAIKNFVNQELIGSLYYNFVLMDRAHITTTVRVVDTIQVVDTIPVVFDLPLEQDTRVVLTRDTPIENATIYLNNQPVPLDLTLRAGTELYINLDMSVPVSQTVPVQLVVPVALEVPVDIALADTQLHDPFIGLQNVLGPYYWRLRETNDSWSEFPFCQGALKGWICKVLLLAD
jgi:hypothetical protein